MSIIMRSHTWIALGAGILISVALFSVFRVIRGPEVNYVSETVARSNLTEIVSVSGVIEAENTAKLAFPVTGIVADVQVDEGDMVAKGDVLITLERNALLADRQDALAALNIAEANRRELLAGPTTEARDVTNTSVAAAEENLVRVIKEESEKVENARLALFSDDLEASPDNKGIQSDAPTITGTYVCEKEGVYVLELFNSGAVSGYSYKLTGLETGVASAYTGSAGTLGKCGLRIQFVEDGRFGSTDWTIAVPNTAGASYVTNLNAYELAVEQRDKRVAEAEEALDLARKEQTLENAAPRGEALDRANATVLQAQARVGAVDAALADRVLQAPFAGAITDVDVLVGETVSSEPIITLLSDETFELTARIPEIDIAKIKLNQRADVVFDAEASETLEATIVFISPLAVEIDGVGYFEAKLQFAEPPTWLRSGLNADIDIVVQEATDVLTLPRRYVTTENGVASVLQHSNNKVVRVEIKTGFSGNDGFVEVIGLKEGAEVLAP